MILVTGAAGFIGRQVCEALLKAGGDVLGIDCLNAYYDPVLKQDRLASLSGFSRFRFIQLDIADVAALRASVELGAVTHMVHLAAQAGVRHSLEQPFAFGHSNLAGHLSMLEAARFAPNLQHFVYASSSSVYGDRAGPFREDDRCDAPASLYAATKRACELMSESYARVFGIAQTGMRFFSVYGAWGRPDMAYWIFTERLLRGQIINVFGGGAMSRDLTHISDIAPAILTLLDLPPTGAVPHAVYNLGNAKPIRIDALIEILEGITGRVAERRFGAAPPGDVTETFADISAANARFGFMPKMGIEAGLRDFVDWYRARYRV